MIYTELTNKALRIAYNAHAGQVDACGQPYIFHPFHLAEQMPDEMTTCVALLHDVVEDTSLAFEDLAQDFPGEVIDALRLLTRKKGQDYFEYIEALKHNPLAKTVKRADLAHNLDITRFSGCETIPQERINAWQVKYKKAQEILEL
ncbi:MAG: HD domain-containing protein [Anaerotardibacter sp.]